VRARLQLLIMLAVGVAGIDLAVAFVTVHIHPEFGHHRSHTWIALSALDCVVMALLARVPSRAVAVGCGLLVGGELGNLIWAVSHDGVVSNPLVIHAGEGGMAFNFADVCELVGVWVLMAALIEVTVRHRHLLPQESVALRVARRIAVALRD
jgi:lipoprotein signal peptidase